MQEIEVPPRDCFKYYVQVTHAPKTIMWNFTTKRKNIGFGLFYQHDATDVRSQSTAESDTTATSPAARRRNLNLNPFSGKRSANGSAGDHHAPSSNNGSPKGSADALDVAPDDASIHPADASAPRARTSSKAAREPALEEILPVQRYESSKTTIKGQKSVDRAGTYVLYFDNTFSRNTSKKMTFFVAMREGEAVEDEAKPELAGWLLKKKRKRMQGWAKRYFVCDRGHLAYFKFPAGFCRGSIPIALSAISVDLDHRIINIDSGTSLWHLRALTRDDYDKWLAVIKRYKAVQAADLALRTRQPSLAGSAAAEEEANEAMAKEAKEATAAAEASLLTFLEKVEERVRGLMAAVEGEDADAVPAPVADAARALADLMAAEKQDLLDQLECEWAKAKSLQLAYQEILRESADLKMRLETTVAAGTPPMPGTPTLPVGSRPFSLISQHRRTNSIASTASDMWFDAEEIVIANGGGESSDEDDEDGARAGKAASTHEMVIYEEHNEDEDEDDDDDSDYSYSHTDAESIAPSMSQRHAASASTSGTGFSGPTVTSALASPPLTMVERRRFLPSPVTGDDVSIMSILRRNIGKDLSTVTMPISLNEPINLLQRLAEELEYSDLLDRAARATDSLDRLKYVAAFAVSGYASTAHRASRKPFNPLHGETYELVRPDRGFKYIAEKVSHYPPIMACHAEGDAGWTFFQDSKIASKFYGRSMEFYHSGTVHVVFPATGDHFTWAKVTTCMRNLIGGGTRSLDHYGKMIVRNHTTGERAEMTFKENGGGGWLGGGSVTKNEVVGNVIGAKGNKVATVQGRWNESLFWTGPDNLSVSIWKANPALPNVDQMYGFTQFTIELNEITDDIADYLPPTDTRFRPDQRLFEEGHTAEAEAEKVRVEEKQRAFRRELEAQGRKWEPRWFAAHPAEYSADPSGAGNDEWVYAGGYWEAREAKAWPPTDLQLW
ncbi:hypothetical protein GGF31_002740 [Allomyces arbusculus]|nr:hypothetical protein GGF31_002740 [Allomyces arbusculus]